MHQEHKTLHLPDYDDFNERISVLMLDVSASELHGQLCGYLCAGADAQGEAFINALLNNKRDSESRSALLELFSTFSISQQQFNQFDFAFEFLLPDDNQPLLDRAQAFSEWCSGFVEALQLAGVDREQFYEEEAQEALSHLEDFALLEYESVEVSEEDEVALMEIMEYARMAVIRLHGDLLMNERERGESDRAH